MQTFFVSLAFGFFGVESLIFRCCHQETPEGMLSLSSCKNVINGPFELENMRVEIKSILS